MLWIFIKDDKYMNVIFLDVDGVLNSMPYFKSIENKDEYDEINDFNLQMLSKIYHTCHAEIVLCSSWRTLDDESDPETYEMYQYLVDSLAKYGMKIKSKTPVIGNNRPLEIATWLKCQIDKNDINFVILDDDFSNESYDKYGIGDKLIRTRYFCYNLDEGGLQQEHVNKAIKILRKGEIHNGRCS